jgi:hypothetical protein
LVTSAIGPLCIFVKITLRLDKTAARMPMMRQVSTIPGKRAIQTGVGPVEVRRAKVRDRGDVGAEEKIRFTSSILPKWARRTKSLDALLPILYLRGVSTGDFQEALCALLGKDARP